MILNALVTHLAFIDDWNTPCIVTKLRLRKCDNCAVDSESRGNYVCAFVIGW